MVGRQPLICFSENELVKALHTTIYMTCHSYPKSPETMMSKRTVHHNLENFRFLAQVHDVAENLPKWCC